MFSHDDKLADRVLRGEECGWDEVSRPRQGEVDVEADWMWFKLSDVHRASQPSGSHMATACLGLQIAIAFAALPSQFLSHLILRIRVGSPAQSFWLVKVEAGPPFVLSMSVRLLNFL